MLPTTSESVFILSVFNLLLSGFLWIVYLFLLAREKDVQRSRSLFVLVGAFFLFSGHLLSRVSQNLEELYSPSLFSGILSATSIGDGLETAAIIFLVFAYLPHWMPAGRLAATIGVALALVVTAAVSYGQPVIRLADRPMSVQWTMNLLLLIVAGGAYLRRHAASDWFNVLPLSAFILSKIVSPDAPLLHGSRHALEVLQLVGLVLFAMILDRKSRDLYVRVFVRLNLIFILLASGLLVAITETERRHYISFAELNLEQLSEFLRGHALYFWKQGQSAEQIMTGSEITRRIIADFGRLPALRRVRIFLDDMGMEMSISGDGTVDQKLWKAGAAEQVSAPPPRVGGERIATLVRLPIFLQQQEIGRIEIDESLQTISSRIYDQIRSVFFAFTVLALLSGALIGLTVREADRTIRRQYQELEQTQEQLIHAAKLASVGELADGIAHEINNPAGIIIARTDYLASVVREGSYNNILDDIEVIRRQARRISGIVGGLLTFSRPSALQVRELDLNRLVRECLELLSPKLYARSIEVQPDLAVDLPPILGDHDRLEQVLINIMNNAIEAMPSGGTVTLQTHLRSREQIGVRISDTGMGIEQEHLPRIFDPFFTTKKSDRGTGLGLSVSYGIVRDHGGTIQASSQSGQGTTFEVILPLGEREHDWL